MRYFQFLLAAVLIAGSTVGWGQIEESSLGQSDSGRVVRLSFVTGSVSVDSNAGTVPGQLNMPLLEGQRISTGQDGQAEIQFEDGSVVRLTPSSQVVLEQLARNGGQNFRSVVDLLNGQFYLELYASNTSQFVVDAAGERFSPQENSMVRVRMDNPPAEIGVMQGTVTVSRDNGFNLQVKSGESLRGDANDASRYFLTENVAQDSWDQWNTERDQQASTEASMRTNAQQQAAGSNGYGWSDLDAYGDWYNIPGEGQVWQPEIAEDASFDPYGYGNWIYYPGAAGYVWASGYPWGWTPFRCGNWNYWSGFGWGWQPMGCGGYSGGWGGYGGVYVRVNHPPSGWRGPIRPSPGQLRPGSAMPPHKIIPVTTWKPAHLFQMANREGRPAMFNHQTVLPLARVNAAPASRPLNASGGNGNAPRRSGGAGTVETTPDRNLQVNTLNNQPLYGIHTTQPGSLVPGSGWSSVSSGGGAAGQAMTTNKKSSTTGNSNTATPSGTATPVLNNRPSAHPQPVQVPGSRPAPAAMQQPHQGNSVVSRPSPQVPQIHSVQPARPAPSAPVIRSMPTMPAPVPHAAPAPSHR